MKRKPPLADREVVVSAFDALRVHRLRSLLSGASMAAAVAAVMSTWDSIVVEGRPLQIRGLGSSEAYRSVRNREIRAGRFLEGADVQRRARVCLVTP